MYFFSYPLPSPRFGYSSSEGFVERHHKEKVSQVLVSRVDKSRYIVIVNAWRTLRTKLSFAREIRRLFLILNSYKANSSCMIINDHLYL